MSESNNEAIDWKERIPGECDDTYYMRVFRAAKQKYPQMMDRELHFGVCDATGLPCLHPFPLRELSGGVRLVDFLAGEPPSRWEDSEYRERLHNRSFCPVCRTWAPSEPVDICRQREQMLARIFTAVVAANGEP